MAEILLIRRKTLFNQSINQSDARSFIYIGDVSDVEESPATRFKNIKQSINHVKLIDNLQALLHRFEAVSDVFEVGSVLRTLVPTLRHALLYKVLTRQLADVRAERYVICY